MKEKLITAGVVFAGIVALALGAKYGVPAEYLAAGGSALLIVAGYLRGMREADAQSADTEKK